MYRGELAKPLRPGQRPEEKLPPLYTDLGATVDFEAMLAFVIRHISGFQRTGPKTRAYPSGPLRWHLKPGEKPEHKLPILYAYVGTSTPKEVLLALTPLHVPGMRPASPMRNGGRRRMRMMGRAQTCAAADVDDAWMCEVIDGIRQTHPRKKLFAIAYDLSGDKPPAGCENPAYGLNPQWIVQRYTNRKRYNKAADRSLRRAFHIIKAML